MSDWKKDLFRGVKVTPDEWLRKECHFQGINIGTPSPPTLTLVMTLTLSTTKTGRCKERGMIKMLWTSHKNNPVPRGRRHDRDFDCGLTRQYNVGDRVEVKYLNNGWSMFRTKS